MRIDRTHRPWLIASCWIFGGCVALYAASLVIAAQTRTSAGGGSALGIVLGSIGFAFMLFAAALGIRKRFPVWRIGRAQLWMRGHLWLGTLALPVIFLHAGFHFGGWLTTLLMALLILVTVSGLIGAYLQHILPGRMMREVSYETIYDQIDPICKRLVAEAEERVGSIAEEMAPGRGAGATVVLTYIGTVQKINPEISEFKEIFEAEIRPYLLNERKQSPLRSREYSAQLFERLRGMLPQGAHATVAALEEICEEKRQLDRQRVLHRTLHAWLFCHIPLSLALILLGFVHAIGALRY